MQLTASNLFEGFGNVLVFAAFGAVFVWLNLFVIGKLILRRPHKPDQGDKGETYECGEPSMGDSWIRFDIRFYTISLIFLIFDIEVALLFPWAAVFDEFITAGYGFAAFIEVLVFLVVLGVGLAYVWARGDLRWTSLKPGRAVSDAALEHGVVTEPVETKEPVAVKEAS
ncbi:MAG: NADH-quinone oxidoreductase subunit A [Planctomycetota bacterium]|nr:NADH-quinone oxidoreductase subunit A [Planctomycetota bacterium]